jgi:hypothetical protein
VCRFLGVEFDARMLAPLRRCAPPARGASVHLARPEPWQRELPEPVIRQADAICGEFAERFGYQPATPVPEPLPLLARVGMLYGSSSALAEKFVFGVVPAGLRASLVNAYSALSARFASVPKAIPPKRA